MSDSTSDTTHEAILHIPRHLHILLLAVTFATFAIVPVPGQTSIAPIGVRCIGAQLMVTVPLESRGGEAKEGEENETSSVAGSFSFAASLPSAQYAQSVASHNGAEGVPLVLPEVTEHGTSSIPVRGELQRDLTVRNDRTSQQIFGATLILARNGKPAPPIQLGLPKLDLVYVLFWLPVLGRLSHTGDALHDTTLRMRPTAEGVYNMAFAKRRLMTSKLAKSDDALLTSAVKKLRNLVPFWPEDSRLGRTLLSSAGAVVGRRCLTTISA